MRNGSCFVYICEVVGSFSIGYRQAVSGNMILTILCKLVLSRLALKTLHFLSYCRSFLSRMKQQKLALQIPPTLDSYNGRQLILQT